jgi:PAS domain-containing protein
VPSRFLTRVIRNKEIAAIAALITKDGSTVVVGMSASLIQDTSGQPTGFRGVARDVTERKRAEEALRASEERYRTVLEANPDPVVVYDMEGKVIYPLFPDNEKEIS